MLLEVVAYIPQITALAILSKLTLQLLQNLRFFHQIKATPTMAEWASLSVLIPARNEESTIGTCVDSLARQSYSNVEIIILDDDSTDRTATVLTSLTQRYPHLKVIHSHATIPIGWTGKNFACHRLAQEAKGDWLLFTDADTEHLGESLKTAIELATLLKVDFLSVFPRQIVKTWSEFWLVSFIIDFFPLIGINFRHLWQGKTQGVAANGQFLLVRAEAYYQSGGHAAIAEAVVDDFALMKQLRSAGFRIAMVDGTAIIRCRMYHSVSEVWHGFAKNIILGLRMSAETNFTLWLIPFFAFGYASLFVLPFIYFLVPYGSESLALLTISWLLGLRLWLSWEWQRPWQEIILTFPAGWGVMALGLSAIYRHWRRQPIIWKGRSLPG